MYEPMIVGTRVKTYLHVHTKEREPRTKKKRK
jgi:hypothetical protein